MANSDSDLTYAAKQKFLKSFSLYGNVTKAAKSAKVARYTPYQWAENDEEFAAAWEQAKAAAADHLEQEAYRRAVTGVLEPIYYQGEQVGTVRKYSDALLTLLLKANRPDKFKERTEHSGDLGVKYIAGISEDDI